MLWAPFVFFPFTLSYLSTILDELLVQSEMLLFMYFYQDCQMAANEGRFKLRDLLSVPMQRVLKYHLLLKVILIGILEDINRLDLSLL